MTRKIKTREEICKIANKRVSKILRNYAESKTKHNKAYSKTRERISKLIEELRLKGIDVSVLDSDLKTLDEKIGKLKSDVESFIKTIENGNSMPCGESQGKYLSNIVKAKEMLKVIRQDKKDIRTFIERTIKAHIKEAGYNNKQ